jgi:hypothetical protein
MYCRGGPGPLLAPPLLPPLRLRALLVGNGIIFSVWSHGTPSCSMHGLLVFGREGFMAKFKSSIANCKIFLAPSCKLLNKSLVIFLNSKFLWIDSTLFWSYEYIESRIYREIKNSYKLYNRNMVRFLTIWCVLIIHWLWCFFHKTFFSHYFHHLNLLEYFVWYHHCSMFKI